MKKAIFFLLVMVMAVTSFAQTSLPSAVYPVNLLDTVTNTGTKYMQATVNTKVVPYYKVLTTAVTVTKISGTVAGTLSIEGSLDSVNWYSLSATTYTATDLATQCFAWSFLDYGVPYIRVKYVGAGTMAASFGAKYIGRNL